MRPFITHLLVLGLSSNLLLHAQNLPLPEDEATAADEVRKAIQEFNRAKQKKLESTAKSAAKEDKETPLIGPSEPREEDIVEMLKQTQTEAPNTEPVIEDTPLLDDQDSVDSEPEAEAEAEAEPKLIIGKLQGNEKAETDTESDSDTKTESEPEPTPTPTSSTPDQAEPAPTPSPEIKPNLEVRVESIREGFGPIDPKTITVKAAAPVKPLSSPPAGWTIKQFDDVPPTRRSVKLKSGAIFMLEVSPHVLIPDTDGNNSFSIIEPSFESTDPDQPKQTISSALANSIQTLEEEADQIELALDQLRQLLDTLPEGIVNPAIDAEDGLIEIPQND